MFDLLTIEPTDGVITLSFEDGSSYTYSLNGTVVRIALALEVDTAIYDTVAASPDSTDLCQVTYPDDLKVTYDKRVLSEAEVHRRFSSFIIKAVRATAERVVNEAEAQE